MSERKLIEGLIEEQHTTLYLTNPWFRRGVDMLVRFLPYFVDGLAADAEAKNGAMQRDVRALSGLPLANAQETE